MSGKHTPGPWSVEDYGDTGVAVVAADVTFDVICWPHPDNARLIAAAPEMLEALKEFCRRVDAGEVRSVKTYAAFNALIAKAEGEP